MNKNYQLVLGRKEEKVLRREIRAVTCSAWIFMITQYLILSSTAMHQITRSTQSDESSLSALSSISFYFLGIAGFAVFKPIMSSVFWCCAQAKPGSTRCSLKPRALLQRLYHDIWVTLGSYVTITGVVLICSVLAVEFNPRVSPGSDSVLINFLSKLGK